jgi:tellurite methyltransferase
MINAEQTISAREKWNQKHRSQPSENPIPDPFLVAHLELLSSGTVLDLACGNGGNSIFLASRNFPVTGVDISDVAVGRLNQYALSNEIDIKAKRMDLETPNVDLSRNLGSHDNIIIFNYKPIDTLWEAIPSLLSPGGIVVYCTFNTHHHHRHGFPSRFCIPPGQHVNPPRGLKLLTFEDLDETGQSRDGYVFKKRHIVCINLG